MKFMLPTAALLASFALAPTASALDAYGRVFVGATDIDAGGFSLEGEEIGGALGLDDLGPFRGEGSAARVSVDAFGPGLHAWNFAGTAFIDIPLGDRFTVSPGVGVDYTRIDFGPGSTDGNGWHWGFQASTPLTDTLSLTGEFRRTELDVSGFDLSADSFELGLSFDL